VTQGFESMLIDALLDMTCSKLLISVQCNNVLRDKRSNLSLKIVDVVQQIMQVLRQFSFELNIAVDA
jgi:hypothetical protein